MGEIINLPTPKPIPPKVSSHEHAGQRYTITYDPIGRRWTWVVSYVQTYKFFGENTTAEAAARDARRQIHKMTKATIDVEERDAK